MRIGIDATSIPSQRGGVGFYIVNLISTLLEIDRENKYFIFMKKGDLSEIKDKANDRFIEVNITSRLARLTWEQTILPTMINRYKIDVFHSPHYTVPFRAKVKKVVTFHDMTFFSHPEYHLKLKVQFFRRIIPRAAKMADQIISNSKNTKNEIIKFLNVDGQKITVTHFAIDKNRYKPIPKGQVKEQIKKKYDIKDEYILFVGTLEPRKNIASLVNNFFRLKENGLFPGKLVLAGGKGWGFSEIQKIIKDHHFGKDVLLVGYVPEDDLPFLFNGATVFVYPSYYEGFGIPPLEAIACGTPTITSNISSIPEIMGEAAVLINPQRSDRLYQSLSSLVQNKAERERLRKAGLQRAEHFTWEKTARETLEVYQK